MGMSQSIYLGCYLIVKVPQKEIEETSKVCGNPDCKQFKKTMSSPFCASCGQPQSVIPNYKKVPLLHLSTFLCDKLNESLMTCYLSDRKLPAGENVVIPNRRSYRDSDHFSDYDGVIPLEKDIVQKDHEWFEEYYKTELIELKKTLGEDNVKIHWGVVKWYS